MNGERLIELLKRAKDKTKHNVVYTLESSRRRSEMPISRDQIEDALSMNIDDYATTESDITKGEMIQIKKHFDKVYGQLELEATADPEDEEDK